MERLPAIAVIAIAAALAACDSNTRFAPAFLRLAEPAPPVEEPPPDAAAVVRDNLSTIFLNQSAPKNVAVSPPIRARFGWTTCVRAEITAVSGKRIGTQTFLLAIEGGKPGLRQRVDQTHACASETYEPV